MPNSFNSLWLQRRPTSALILIVVIGGRASAFGLEPKSAKIDYATRIAPLLAMHCVRCHGPKLQESELRLDTLDHIERGGKRGPAAIPGKSEESPIIRAVLGERPYREMLPDAPSLPPGEIKLLAIGSTPCPLCRSDLMRTLRHNHSTRLLISDS
jgi:hypothetical protein